MTDQRTLATRLIAVRVLKDLLAEADTATRAELMGAMLAGDRQTAAVHGKWGGPVPVGSVVKTKPSAGGVTASVTDADALAAWCEVHAPTEVHTVRVVRQAFQRQLLDTVKTCGGWPDPYSGEVHEVPGVTVTPAKEGASVLQVKPNDEAATLIRQAWQSGALSVDDVLALPEAS